jgi:hypothetical protein
MNVHQHVLPTTVIAIPNVFVLGTQTMNHTIVHVNYQKSGHNLL